MRAFFQFHINLFYHKLGGGKGQFWRYYCRKLSAKIVKNAAPISGLVRLARRCCGSRPVPELRRARSAPRPRHRSRQGTRAARVPCAGGTRPRTRQPSAPHLWRAGGSRAPTRAAKPRGRRASLPSVTGDRARAARCAGGLRGGCVSSQSLPRIP